MELFILQIFEESLIYWITMSEITISTILRTIIWFPRVQIKRRHKHLFRRNNRIFKLDKLAEIIFLIIQDLNIVDTRNVQRYVRDINSMIKIHKLMNYLNRNNSTLRSLFLFHENSLSRNRIHQRRSYSSTRITNSSSVDSTSIG